MWTSMWIRGGWRRSPRLRPSLRCRPLRRFRRCRRARRRSPGRRGSRRCEGGPGGNGEADIHFLLALVLVTESLTTEHDHEQEVCGAMSSVWALEEGTEDAAVRGEGGRSV